MSLFVCSCSLFKSGWQKLIYLPHFNLDKLSIFSHVCLSTFIQYRVDVEM